MKPGLRNDHIPSAALFFAAQAQILGRESAVASQPDAINGYIEAAIVQNGLKLSHGESRDAKLGQTKVKQNQEKQRGERGAS